MREVVICSAVRTAIGNFGGSLKDVPAVELGAAVIKGVLEKVNLSPDKVDEILMGNVISTGLGQNPARQASMIAGVPDHVPSMTISKVCGSGLRAVSLAYQMINSGESDVVIAGGMENMSQAPYAVPSARWGARMGDSKMVDTMIKDALWDAFNDYHMGVTAENIAQEWGITREMQDEFAVNSQNKAITAIDNGEFEEEIVPILVPQRKKDPIEFKVDEFPRRGTKIENLAKLRAAFRKDGSVTPGNASGINDGAAAVLIMSAEKAKELGIKPMAKILSFGSKGLDPAIMGYGPVASTNVALSRAGISIGDVDLIEANEAFAAQSLAVARDLEFDMEKVNVNGGAIALGHPVGASGARILVTLLHGMEKRNSKIGLATLCIGGGQGTSLIVERI